MIELAKTTESSNNKGGKRTGKDKKGRSVISGKKARARRKHLSKGEKPTPEQLRTIKAAMKQKAKYYIVTPESGRSNMQSPRPGATGNVVKAMGVEAMRVGLQEQLDKKNSSGIYEVVPTPTSDESYNKLKSNDAKLKYAQGRSNDLLRLTNEKDSEGAKCSEQLRKLAKTLNIYWSHEVNQLQEQMPKEKETESSEKKQGLSDESDTPLEPNKPLLPETSCKDAKVIQEAMHERAQEIEARENRRQKEAQRLATGNVFFNEYHTLPGQDEAYKQLKGSQERLKYAENKHLILSLLADDKDPAKAKPTVTVRAAARLLTEDWYQEVEKLKKKLFVKEKGEGLGEVPVERKAKGQTGLQCMTRLFIGGFITASVVVALFAIFYSSYKGYEKYGIDPTDNGVL